MTGAYFDALAATYDQVWSEAAIGRAQRDAVWRVMDDVFCSGDRVLDIGCGTGVDAVHLGRRGVTVVGIDASAEMVHRAKSKGVDARHLPIESLREVGGPFSGAISNFGALNCVGNLALVATDLSRLILPGGRVAICVMGPLCIWEIGFFLLHLNPRKAFRRFVAQPLRLQRRDSSRRLWPRLTDQTRIGELPLARLGKSAGPRGYPGRHECPRHAGPSVAHALLPAWSAVAPQQRAEMSLGAAGTSARATICGAGLHPAAGLQPASPSEPRTTTVYYPTIRQLTRAFSPHFQLLHWRAIGLSVPPSYVKSLSVRTIARLAAIDQRIAHLPGLRALADHRLLVFQRL